MSWTALQARAQLPAVCEGLLFKSQVQLEGVLQVASSQAYAKAGTLSYEQVEHVQRTCKSSLSSLRAAVRDAAAATYRPADLVPGTSGTDHGTDALPTNLVLPPLGHRDLMQSAPIAVPCCASLHHLRHLCKGQVEMLTQAQLAWLRCELGLYVARITSRGSNGRCRRG
jgi:hypothetical protein